MPLSQNNNHTFVSGELVTSAKLNSTKIIQSDTEANNDNFTGNPGQLTYDSTNKKLRLHDGQTAGGLEVTPTQGGVSLGAGSVNTSALVDGAVTEVKLATDSVSENKILDGAVTASKLASDAISLGAGSVTSEMLATGAIESIDDIGDVKTAGTSGGVNHAPSDGDALVWNNSHSHWMPGEVLGNTLGLKVHAWGIFSGYQGSSNTRFIKHSRNIRLQNIPDSTASGYDAWVLDSPIDMPMVIISASGYATPTSTQSTPLQSRMQHNRGRSQIFKPPSEDYGYYTFVIYDISGAEMYESGDTMSPATYTITQAGFNSDND